MVIYQQQRYKYISLITKLFYKKIILFRYFHYFADDFGVVHYAGKFFSARSVGKYRDKDGRMALRGPLEVGACVFAFRVNDCESAGLMVSGYDDEGVAVFFGEVECHVDGFVEVNHLFNHCR